LLGYAYGSNYSACASEITCGFDTHYPEYFPPREGFETSLAALQKLGVRVAPYINGRIFDQATQTWTRDQASRFAAKNLPNPTLNNQTLALYNESYGSQALFAVMCPHTDYWQATIADVVGTLVQIYGTDGVYIDQIAAAVPKPCWDPSHNHSLGGGHYWVDGYRSMLQNVRAQAGDKALILTEANAEPYMQGVNMFLTLTAFAGDFAGGTHIVPAFPAIYGGYVFTMGSEFFQEDLLADPDVFAAKLPLNLFTELNWAGFLSGVATTRFPQWRCTTSL